MPNITTNHAITYTNNWKSVHDVIISYYLIKAKVGFYTLMVACFLQNTCDVHCSTCIFRFYFQAIDKELEQKEGYESFSVPQQTHQQPVANAWPHALMQQQQQQQCPGMLFTLHYFGKAIAFS